jgi:hypothetical protein
MSSTLVLRALARTQPTTFFRANKLRKTVPRASFILPGVVVGSSFSTSSKLLADKDGGEASHSHEESFEEFTAR